MLWAVSQSWQLGTTKLSDVAVVGGFHVATFYSEGPPYDKGLALQRPYELLRSMLSPWCAHFHGYSLRRVRSLVLSDGTRGADFTKEYSAVAGYLRYPNTGYNAIGFGAFKPFIVLHVLERMRRGEVLLFLDCNVQKHWNLGAFPELAAPTTRWLLDAYGHEGAVMPRENPSTRHVHICSAAALDAAEAACDGKRLAELPSPHSNRLAVRAGRGAERLMRLWLNASRDEATFLPSPTRKGGRWHTPEQCSYGLVDACRHGPSELWFEYFFTPRHARLFQPSSRLRGVHEPALAVSRSRTPPAYISATTRWGKSLDAIADQLQLARATWQRARAKQAAEVPLLTPPSPSAPPLPRASAQRSVDACLLFPRHGKACPGVRYVRANATHWALDTHALGERTFTARPLRLRH